MSFTSTFTFFFHFFSYNRAGTETSWDDENIEKCFPILVSTKMTNIALYKRTNNAHGQGNGCQTLMCVLIRPTRFQCLGLQGKQQYSPPKRNLPFLFLFVSFSQTVDFLFSSLQSFLFQLGLCTISKSKIHMQPNLMLYMYLLDYQDRPGDGDGDV